jgi:hypothetical protein
MELGGGNKKLSKEVDLMAVWLSRNEGNGGGMEWHGMGNKKNKIEMMGFKSSWSSPTNQAFFRTSLALTADGL